MLFPTERAVHRLKDCLGVNRMEGSFGAAVLKMNGLVLSFMIRG